MSTEIKGGINIAMKVPSHQYEAVIAFYRDVVGLPLSTRRHRRRLRSRPQSFVDRRSAALQPGRDMAGALHRRSRGGARSPRSAQGGALRSGRGTGRGLPRRMDHEPRQYRPPRARAGCLVDVLERKRTAAVGSGRHRCIRRLAHRRFRLSTTTREPSGTRL